MDKHKIVISSQTSRYSVCIGHKGEYNVNEIIFDCSEFATLYGNGTAKIVYNPSPASGNG